MPEAAKYLTGDASGIQAFLDKFDVSQALGVPRVAC